MNISSRFTRAISTFFSDGDSDVLANGRVIDKKDVENPTGKFSGPKHIGTVFKGGSSQRRNVTFMKPEYDLPMIANAVQLDGILRRSRSLFVEHILKNHYEITSKDIKAQKYVHKRLKEIQNLTGISFYSTLEWISSQLITYGNAYLIKQRDKDKSQFGKKYRLYGKLHEPIVGVFLADATTIEIGLNNKGTVVSYKQTIRGESRQWDERDVIHFTYDQIPGVLTGMSPILPVLDDVRALRKLEEEIEILGFQYSIPLYLYKVGNKDIPPAPGEVEEVTSVVNSMPPYGMLVVPGHHDITIPSNTNNMVDIIKYVNHFKGRIYAGLGISPVAMGDAGTNNKNTAEVLDSSMQTITKSYQNSIKYKLEMEFFREILLDGGFNKLETELEFSFPEIDLENQIKKATNIIQLWQNNLVTRTEARNLLDHETVIGDKDTFLYLIDIPKIDAEAKVKAQVASSSSSNAKNTDTKVRPANQHGKSTGRPKYTKNSNVFDGLNVFNVADFSSTLISTVNTGVTKELTLVIDTLCKYHHVDKIDADQGIVDRYISGLSVIVNDYTVRASKMLDDEIKISLLNISLRGIVDNQSSKLDNLAKILIYKSLGYKTILVTSDNCAKHTDNNLDITNIAYSNIPPLSYRCNCKIDEKGLNEFR